MINRLVQFALRQRFLVLMFVLLAGSLYYFARKPLTSGK